ncbi:MAG: sensor histidine kinase [Polaribacter sp.]|uniref:sensor histidine kinase n=1 Tax=Polaribacter sp. TaxID=1920175 RepID=UPI0032657F79
MKKTLSLLLLLILFNGYSQEVKKILLESFHYTNTYQLDSALNYNSKIDNKNLRDLLNLNVNFLRFGKISNRDINILNSFKTKDSTIKVIYNILKGDYFLNNFLGRDDKALEYYTKAYKASINSNDTLLLCESLKKLVYYTLKFNRDSLILKRYNKNHKKYIYNTNEEVFFLINQLIYKIQVSANSENPSPINQKYFDHALKKALSTKNKILEANIYHLMGLNFAYFKKEYNKATKYYTKAYSIYVKYKDEAFAQHRIFNYYISLGAINFMRKKFNESIKQLKIAEKNQVIANKKRDVESMYMWFHLSYSGLKQYNIAYKYSLKEKKISDSINQIEKDVKLNDLNIKYQTSQKEKENLQLKIDKEKNRNLLIASLIFIFTGGIISILAVKSSKRKRKLAEQLKQLEVQKNLTLLKEQELTTINAMVDGQEKERKRIAEDLHDNLGSVLATLKLHFENLKINREKQKINQETLFDKTEGLIDEAYLKVRSIAHAKNAGVIANQGLLTAVIIMAEKISSADKIKIEVIHFGLDKRLKNSLEITIFRIIQELITNILKHADAQISTINISLFDKNLNIIIEDDGKGFDINKVNLKNGMGISSINTRVEHLNGTFKIDSSIGKGSSIIIDIPIF